MLTRLFVLPMLLFSLAVSASAARAATPAETLAKLCDEYWKGHLAAYPTSATSLGIKKHDDRLEDLSRAGIAKERRRLVDVLARARAIDEKALAPRDRLTRTALVTETEGQLASLLCDFHEWVVDPLGGPQVGLMNLADYTTIDDPADAKRYVARMRATERYLDDHVANLREGLARGKVASRDAVQKTVEQLARLVESPPESLGAWKPAAVERPGWSAEARRGFARDLREAITRALLPALRRYHAFLEKEVLPAARPPERAGLAALAGGEEAYRRMIRVHTSLDLDPEALHQLGLEQVAAFRRDLGALGAKAFGTSNVTAIQARLRGRAENYFATEAEVEAKARETLARAQAAVPGWFGAVQPKAPCEVKVMGMHEAPYSTIAYYRQPSADGKRPGTYMINTYRPETRPRYEAEALAFHESVPGHHLQIAVAQELTGVPEFRKHQGVTAFVEGWALYTERLADEMGLYSGDIDRMGMLSYDAWRACRLVVDTGLHVKGWTRQQAIDYMLANSLLAENNVVNEVDRYLTWPGQALAYKVGQLEILRLREEAKKRLGDRFDIKAFHDAVLGNGAVSLPVLREQVEAYIAAAGRNP